MSRSDAVDEKSHKSHTRGTLSCAFPRYAHRGWRVDVLPHPGWGYARAPPSAAWPDRSQGALRRSGAARRAGTVGRAGLRQRTAERLDRRLGDVVVVLTGGLDVHRAAGFHREALERMRQQRQRQPADPLAAEGEPDLGMRPADEVDGSG